MRTKQYKYLNKAQVQKYAHALNEAFLASFDNNTKFPITHHMMHNDQKVRCHATYDNYGHIVIVDIPIKEFNTLPGVYELPRSE